MLSNSIKPDLDMIHRAPDYVVVNKPSGLFSVPGRGEHKQDSVAIRVARTFPDADGPISVHRLDMETSGLMVLALTRPAHRALSRQFINRKVGKCYLGVLDGIPSESKGEIDLPIIVDWPNRPRQIVDHERGKSSQTLYRVVDVDEQAALSFVEFRPKTGRTHQLRIHSAMPRDEGGIGCPILGDTLYGDPTRAPRLMLHANHLAFWTPGTGEWVKFDSAAPFDLQSCAAWLACADVHSRSAK